MYIWKVINFKYWCCFYCVMSWCDFVVKHDFAVEDDIELTKKIIYSIFVKRLKAHKPAVVFLGGDSGEGKSLGANRIVDLFFQVQGMAIRDCFDIVNVYTPFQYPEKLDKLLMDSQYKKVNAIIIHEAREVVKAKNWHSFVNTAISDVNAMSRSVKRMLTVVCSQFIRDISTDIRYTLNFYCVVRRPKNKKARLYINVMWKDDRDLEKPKLRKRKLSGYIIGPDKRYRRYVPQYLELSLIDGDLVKRFETSDREAKIGIIRDKMARLMDHMKEDAGIQTDKVKDMLDWYEDKPDALASIGRRFRGKWKLRPDAVSMHQLTKFEAERFEDSLNKRLTDRGVISGVDKGDGEEV